MTPLEKNAIRNQHHCPIALRAPFYSDYETMPEGMDNFKIFTVYCYYDMPLMYTIENGEEMYFSYWLGEEQDGDINLIAYIPFSKEEQVLVESGKICLRGMLTSKPAMVVGYNKTKEGWPIEFVRRNVILENNKEELPKEGLAVTIFSANQKEGDVAVYYRLDSGLSFDELVKSVATSICGLWDSFFATHKESGKTLMYWMAHSFYKNWFNTCYAYSSSSNQTELTPNFTVNKVHNESVLKKIEEQAGKYDGLDTSTAKLGEFSVCVSTISIKSKQDTLPPFRSSHEIILPEPKGDERNLSSYETDAANLFEELGEEAFNQKLTLSVMEEINVYHDTLKQIALDDGSFAYEKKENGV